MYITIKTEDDVTDYHLHRLKLAADAHLCNQPGEFFVISDITSSKSVNVRLFLYRDELKNLRDQINAALACTEQEPHGIKVEDVAA